MEIPALPTPNAAQTRSIVRGANSGRRFFRGRAFRHVGLLVGATILAIMILSALFAHWISPHDPLAQDIVNRRLPPIWDRWFTESSSATWEHLLGTDKLGRDYLSRLLHGARVSLMVGFAAALMSGVIGTTLGVLGGYFGGRVDMAVSFLTTTRLALPVVLVALAVVSLRGSSLLIIILVLGLLLWDRFAVVMRAVTRQARNMEYVAAAEALGCSTARIIVGEILPNVMNAFIVVVTIEMANAILFEAALSFLGMGVQPPTPSWGLMLAEAKEEIFFAPWMIAIPGIALFVLVFAINMLGDGIRDVTAPKGRS